MGNTMNRTQEGHVAIVTLDRPEHFNSLNMEMANELFDEFSVMSKDPGVKAVIITGTGKAFCAGGDLKWMLGHPAGSSTALHQLAAKYHLSVLEIRRMAKPVIATLNGVAAGAGFTLALACDFRVMADTASMVQAYTSSGLSLDGGGSFTLPRIVGIAKAMEIAAFDKPIPAEEALALGLATKVVKKDALMESAMEMATYLSKRSLHSFGWSKQLINNAFDTSLETQLEQERLGIETCGGHPDGQEGIKAFQEKRKPVFN